MCSLPRPPTPTQATRSRSFGPVFFFGDSSALTAEETPASEAAAAANSDCSRKSRRVCLDIRKNSFCGRDGNDCGSTQRVSSTIPTPAGDNQSTRFPREWPIRPSPVGVASVVVTSGLAVVRSSRADSPVGELGRFEKQAAAFVVEQAADFGLVGDRCQKQLVDDVVRQAAQQVDAGPIGGGGKLGGADQVRRGLLPQRADRVAGALARSNQLQSLRQLGVQIGKDHDLPAAGHEASRHLHGGAELFPGVRARLMVDGGNHDVRPLVDLHKPLLPPAASFPGQRPDRKPPPTRATRPATPPESPGP